VPDYRTYFSWWLYTQLEGKQVQLERVCSIGVLIMCLSIMLGEFEQNNKRIVEAWGIKQRGGYSCSYNT